MAINESPYAAFNYIRVRREGAVGVVAMLDPVGPDFLEKQHPMHTELRDIFSALAGDPEVEAVVLTGDGAIFFAGPNVDATEALLTGSFIGGAKQMFEARQICNALLDFPKPIVSALNGAVIGMGCQLAFLCDFSVAATGIRIQDTHVRLGLPAGDGGTMMWPLLVGMAKARQLLLRAHPLMAEEALELGLVTEVVPQDELLQTAVKLAAKLASLPKFAYSATRLALNQWMRLGGMVSFDTALGLELAAFATADFQAGIAEARRRAAG